MSYCLTFVLNLISVLVFVVWIKTFIRLIFTLLVIVIINERWKLQ